MENPSADIFQFVVDEVFTPIKIGPGARTSLRTRDDNWQGQVYAGSGLWWIQDDVAKIASLLNEEDGLVDGHQILHPDMLRDAMQNDPEDQGVFIRSGRKYNHGFWAAEFTRADGSDCDFWVPHMLGYSGNTIALMPNGSTFYHFIDNREFNWVDAVRESNKIISHCQ